MNSKIRVESKALLSKNTTKLFFTSFFSFILRYAILILTAYGIYSFYKSSLFFYLNATYNSYLVYAVASFLAGVLILSAFLFISGIRLGESFVYFTRANGGSSKVTLLFRFLSFSCSLKALSLYAQINIRKLLWLLYFSLPTIICGMCIYYLHSISFISQPVYYILFAGTSVIFAFSIVMHRISCLRISASPYYLSLNRDITPLKAIKKSIRFTDGFLSEGAVLEYSLIGWILSCFLVIPLFYAVPYIKLTKAVFVTEAVFSKATAKSAYAINLLKLA